MHLILFCQVKRYLESQSAILVHFVFHLTSYLSFSLAKSTRLQKKLTKINQVVSIVQVFPSSPQSLWVSMRCPPTCFQFIHRGFLTAAFLKRSFVDWIIILTLTNNDYFFLSCSGLFRCCRVAAMCGNRGPFEISSFAVFIIFCKWSRSSFVRRHTIAGKCSFSVISVLFCQWSNTNYITLSWRRFDWKIQRQSFTCWLTCQLCI